MSKENVERVRDAWAAWQRGDIDTMMQTWDADITWDVTHFKDWPESSYHGFGGVRKFLAEWREMWGEYEVDLEEVRPAPDGRVVSLFTQRGKGQGSGLQMVFKMAQISTYHDGKLVLIDNYDDQDEALKAAGLSE
jgi:ketosteroid isomerase-like protein